MPGLFGVLRKTGDLPGERLRIMGLRMADSMRSVPWLQTETWTDGTFFGGRVHLGVLNPAPQPLSAKHLRAHGWFDGDVWSAHSGEAIPITAERLQDWLLDERYDFADVDGGFSAALYDERKGELILANDRLGFRPLYWAETKSWFAYAAEAKALLSILDFLPDLDRVGLRQFFGFGYMLGERTWWQGISLVPPATIWRISAGRRDRRRYWTFGTIRRDPRSEQEVQDELGRLWARTIQGRIRPGRMPLQLSGGLDSRLLLAEMRAHGAEIVAITYGDLGSADMRIARRCAERARVPHRAVSLDVDTWWHGREEAIWQTDGLVNGLHLHAAIAAREMHVGARYSLQHSTGDTLYGGSWLGRGNDGDWARSPRRLLERMYLRNPFFSLDDVVEASLPDCEPYLEGPSLDCFTISQRQRRMILTGPIALSSHCEVINPGVGMGMLRLLLGCLTDDQRRGSRFYARFLAQRHPEYFRTIPWQKTGRALGEPWPVRLALGLRERAARRLGRPIRARYYADYGEFVEHSRVRDVLRQDHLLLDEVLDGAGRRALQRSTPSELHFEPLLAILTAEVYLRQVAGVPLTGWVTPSEHDDRHSTKRHREEAVR